MKQPLLKVSCLALSLSLGASAYPDKLSPSRPDPDPEKNRATIRVMSYNIHHGRGIDEVVDLERIAEVIRREKPDVVALQEVDRGVRRTDGRDLPAELAELTGMRVFFGANLEFQGGDYGNAILSRFPASSEANTHFRMLREGEQRGVLQVVLEAEGGAFLFMNTHIDYRPDDTERLLNVEQLKEIVASYDSLPVIITGDFNDLPGSRTHLRMKDFLTDAWEVAGEGDGFTYRADRPEKRIDYVFTSEEITPKSARVPQTLASDHLPLVVDVEIAFGE